MQSLDKTPIFGEKKGMNRYTIRRWKRERQCQIIRLLVFPCTIEFPYPTGAAHHSQETRGALDHGQSSMPESLNRPTVSLSQTFAPLFGDLPCRRYRT